MMNEKIDLVSQPKKSFWKLSIPIIAFCIFDSIYGIVDMAWITQINIHASFAVGISIPFVSLIFSFGDSLGRGTNSLISRYIGFGDYESGYNTLIHGIIITNIIWVLILFCSVFAQEILYSVNPADSYLLAMDYLMPILTFAYIFMFVNFFSETLQAEGNSRIPTIFIISSNILNIILDPIFIFNLNLGVKGASYATILSSLIPFIVFVLMYLLGRTKIPLSRKYFKFHPYILIEICKVAFPNFLDEGLWTFTSSFINGILTATMGPVGPVIYSASNKLKTLLNSPVRGYGRALMSVTGHLFGAHEFDELYEMYKYTLKICVITTIVVMIAFIILRDYAFSLFSITGMQTEILWIAILGTVIMISLPFTIVSSKMLDGFGKSMYSLFFIFIKLCVQCGVIYVLNMQGISHCVLIGVTVSEVLSAIIFYAFLRYLFRNFDEKYKNKDVVKTFNSDNETESLKEHAKIKDDWAKNKTLRKVLLNVALIVMIICVISIILSLISINDQSIVISGIIGLIIFTLSIFLITKLDKPIISLSGVIVSAVILFTFMHSYGNRFIQWFIIAGALMAFIFIILKR